MKIPIALNKNKHNHQTYFLAVFLRRFISCAIFLVLKSDLGLSDNKILLLLMTSLSFIASALVS